MARAAVVGSNEVNGMYSVHKKATELLEDLEADPAFTPMRLHLEVLIQNFRRD